MSKFLSLNSGKMIIGSAYSIIYHLINRKIFCKINHMTKENGYDAYYKGDRIW